MAPPAKLLLFVATGQQYTHHTHNSLEQKTSRPKLTLAMQNARMDYLSVLVPFDRCLLLAYCCCCPSSQVLGEVAWIETFFSKMHYLLFHF